jgi:hypothetical protein
VLRWSRLVIIIERVNLGAMPEEKSGDLYRLGELQLPLAVAAFGMDEGWIVCDQGREFPPSCQDSRSNQARRSSGAAFVNRR